MCVTDVGVAVTNLRVVCKSITCVSTFIVLEKVKAAGRDTLGCWLRVVWRSQPSALARASGSKPILHLSQRKSVLVMNIISAWFVVEYTCGCAGKKVLNQHNYCIRPRAESAQLLYTPTC